MTTLREAAQQALEALQDFKRRGHWGDFDNLTGTLQAALVEDAMQKFTDVNQELQAVLGCDHCNQPLYAATKCRVCGRVTEPVQDTGVKCMPSECPNCASLQDQNTELDRQLAEMEQTSLELCETCGWRTLIPGDCCLNCVRPALQEPTVKESLQVPAEVAATMTHRCKTHVPLTEEEIEKLLIESAGMTVQFSDVDLRLARAIERAHGIGGDK